MHWLGQAMARRSATGSRPWRPRKRASAWAAIAVQAASSPAAVSMASLSMPNMTTAARPRQGLELARRKRAATGALGAAGVPGSLRILVGRRCVG